MKIKKILWSIILGVYLATDILGHLWYIDWNVAEAATSWKSTNPIVAILIDNDTYNSIGSNWNFKRYTDSYIPEKYPGSESIIFSLDLKEYTAPEIVKLLENVYFDGIKNTSSRLIWVIVMGKVPLPVVKYQNYIFPSIYPYTDFIEQKYIWDETQWYFIQNKTVWEAEIWHWLISLNDASKYDKFFTKLKKYQNDPEKFIDKKIWYDDFIALNKNFLQETYQLYKNKVIFAEDLIYHRYTNFLIDMLQVNQQNENADILWDLQEAMAALDVHIPEVETAKEELLNNKTEFTPTLLLQQKIESFLKDYHEIISTTLLKTIDDNIKAWDRWTVNDSHYQKIQIKDQLLFWNEDANWIFKSVNDKLEKYVDDKIAKEKYAMKVTIPIYYQRWKDKRKRFLWIKRYVPEYKDTYEFYYFGKNARTINDPKDFSIFRGTFRNLDHFVNYSSIIGDSLNPAKTNYDSTDLTKRWVGSSYDLFSTQVEANRWYNILNMETEYDTYNAEKRHARLEEWCRRYWFWIKLFWCREREWEPDWTCVQWSTDPDDTEDCETFIDFGNRVRWGGTPLNLDMDKYQDQIYEFKWKYDYRNAIKPIFDIAGSVKLKTAEPRATSYDAATEYISPIMLADKGWNILRTDIHTAYTDAWYFKLPLYLLNDDNFKKNSSNEFTIKKEKRSNTDEELTYMYRIIPSVIKHDSTQETEINGYSWYRYDENSETYAYYQSIMQALEAAKDDWYSTEVNKSMSDVKETIDKLIQKIRWTDNYEVWCDTWEILTWIKELNPEILKALVDIWTQTKWQLENWRKFNAIFWNNYWATVESLVEWFKQHQIDLNSPIDIRSKRYNEILTKISQVARDLEDLRSIAKLVFNNYNSVFAMIEAAKDAVQKKIDEVQEIIDDLTETNETLDWENETYEGEIETSTATIGEKQSANAGEEQNLKTLEERLAKEQWERAEKEKAKLEKEWLLKEKQDAFEPDKDEYERLLSGKNALLAEKETKTSRKTALTKEINDKNKLINDLTEANKKLQKEIDGYDNSNWAYTSIIKEKQKIIKENEQEIKKAQQIIDDDNKELNEINERLPKIEEELNDIEKDIAPLQKKKDEIDDLIKGIGELQKAINDYDNKILPWTQKEINDCKGRMGQNSSEITAAQNTIKDREWKIATNKSTIEENKKIIDEATIIRDEWLAVQPKIEQLERKVEVWLNILEKCTANHSVLWNVLDMDESLIHYWDETNECEEDENQQQQWGTQGNDADDVITVLIEELNEAKTVFKKNFNSDPNNPIEKTAWMNLLTQDRPIDSPRYISFQWIWEHVIKIIYPDIFKVEVYKSWWKGLTLKKTAPENSKNEIYNALKKYFENKVKEYNTILKNEYDNAKTINKYYTYIQRVDPLWTPDKSVRPYWYFTYDEMIAAIGWDEMLYTLAELLYYQSVSNHIREYFDNVWEDINETRSTFDINKKIGYIMEEYLKEDNDKIYRWEKIEWKDIKWERKSYAWLVIPTYSTWWYEVWYINSNWADNIAPDVDDIDITLKWWQSATRSLTADELWDIWYDDEPWDDEASLDIKKDCWYDPNEPLSLYDGSWFKWLACWLKAVAHKPVTVKVYFQTSPTISSISEPLEQTWDDYKNSFKSTIEWYADMPKSDENLNQRTQDILTNTQITWNDNKVSITWKTWSLNFLSFKDLWNIIVKVESTWDNCLIINWWNTCWGPVTVNKNPYKEWFSLDYTLWKDTVWNVVADISLCWAADNCWVRGMSLAVVPWPVSTFKIETTTDNKVLAWTYSLLNIIALDSKWNEISRTLEKYYVKVNKWTLFINWVAKETQEINDFATSTMLYRAEKWTSWTVTVTVEDAKWKVMWKNTITIYPWDLKINDKDTEQIKYQVSDEKYYNDDWSINTKKAIPIKLTLKNGWQIIKITSNVAFDSKNKLAKIMVAEETKDDKGNKKIKLRQTNSLMIEKWERTVYLVPWYKAGNDEITVTVPWLDPKKILLKVEPGEMRNIGVTLENDTIYPEDTLKGEVELTDARWNKIEKTTTISAKSTSELKISPSEEPSVAQWSRKFTLPTTEDDVGIHKIYIKGKSSDWQEIAASKRFTVKNFFLKWAIESGLNIMYLNLFGNDWWNQWWYNSDNNKFAENIIQKSSKTLAVTTQLIAPSKIQETAIIFWKNWNIQNLWSVKLNATLDSSKLKINVNNVWDFTINDNIEKIIAIKSDVTNERIENAIKNEKSKVIYLFDIDEEYTYDGWIFLNDKWEKFADIRNWMDFELWNYNLATKPVWNISYKWKQLAYAIIANLDYSKVEAKIEWIWYELGEIFDRWSTTSKVKALLSTTNTLNEAYQWYDSIQNSDELDKYIWFRANFKNITLFAEWESVWESTVPFGSEFLINIWDPLLKNRDEIASKRWLWQVKFSEPWKSIYKVTDIDYNWDWLRDLIVIYRDWSINLIKQYSNNKYEELWTLMISAEQIDEVFVWDVDWNGYEDIIIKNWRNQMRAYTNTDWVFDVDWNVICLNVNAKAWETNPDPGDLSWVIQLFVEDMDNDWRSDIVTLDRKWYLKITYWNGTKSRHSYLSKDVYDCDKGWLERQQWSTKVIKKFGIKLASKWISDDSILRWSDLRYPGNDEIENQVIKWKLDANVQQTDLEKQWIYIPESEIEKWKSWNISEDDIGSIIGYTSDVNTTEQAQKASEAASVYLKNPFVWKYLDVDSLNDSWIAFITMYNIEKYNSLTNTKKVNKPTKSFVDKNWGELDDWDEIEVTVTITTNWVKLSEYFDKISWPWIVDRDPNTWAPKDLKFTNGTWKIIQWMAWYDFGIIDIKWSSWIAWWWALQFKYTLKYHLEDPVYRIKIVREKPLSTISVIKAEEEDTTILRWNWLKYEEKNKDILIKNPFGTRFKINDWLNNGEQGYINLNDIVSYINRTNSKEVYVMDKNYKDLNWWSLDNWDPVEVRVTIPLPKSHANINVILEDIKGPWNESWLPKSFQFTKGTGTVKNWINWYDFNITNITPISNGDEYIFEYKYTLTFKETTNTNTDNLPSIIVQPVDWCVKKEEVLKNNTQDKNRAYDSEIVDLQKYADDYAKKEESKNTEANDKVNKEIEWASKNWTDDSTILNSIKEKFTIEDMLKEVWWKVLDNNWLDFWNVDLDITKVMWVDLKKMEKDLQKFATSLCHWFTFWTKWGTKTCEWLPVPFNQAFLAPGNYHIMWCIPLEPLTQTLGNGLPMFHFPWTLYTPFGPIPIPWWLKWSTDDFLWVGWGTYPSLIRIYAAPTLTAQLWIAICLWPQKVWMYIPSPVSDIWGNCIVTAIALPCPSWWGWDDDEDEDEGETFEDWVWEYGNTNLCNPQDKESPFTMIASDTLNSKTYPSSPSEWPYLWWLVNIDYDPINSYSNGFGESDAWIEINGVKIQWAKDITNKLLWGMQQWIQKILVDWIDRQVQYWINNLLRFEIQFTFPDLTYLSEEINKIGSSNIQKLTDEKSQNHKKDIKLAEDATKGNKKAKERMKKQIKTVHDNTLSKGDIKKLNLAEWANPFKELQDLFNETELVNITTQSVPIRIPRIYSEDIEAYWNYLLTWYEDNSTVLKWWEATVEAAIHDCDKKSDEDKSNPERAAHCKLVREAKTKIMKLSNKFDKIGPQIFQNVQTLEAYKRFPLQIYEWLHVTDKYIGDISALVWNFFWYINFWMDVNANRFSQYCDAIITIVTIVKTYQIMIDLFVDWWAKCWKCTQDTYDQYSCKLSFLCNAFEIPTIPIPSVKIPSLYIDLSHFNLQMNIRLPRFKFVPEPVELPRLPNLPQPPQLGVNFNIDFDIPDIPQLPQPPELPELPSFIPQVKLELPILPPAPEIPEIPNKITWLLSVAKTLSKIFCIIKSWIWLVWEKSVKARIEQMTQRSYEVPRVDNLDLTIYFKQTPLQGIDIAVDSFVNLQYNFDAFYSLLKSIVDPINQATYSLLQEAENWVQYLDAQSSEATLNLNRATNQNIMLNVEVSKTNTPDKMKEQLYELRDTLLKDQDKQKVDQVIAYASTNTKVEKNEKGISKIEEDLNKLLKEEKENVIELADLAKNNYDWFLNSIKDRKEDSPYQLTYATNLLNKNAIAEEVIANSNAMEMFIETEDKKVEWYYSALKNHTAEELNMTEETYENSIRYMASIKDKINQWYSIKRSEYEGTTTLTDDAWNSVSRTLLTATSNTTPSKNEASTNDYSQYVQWIYIKDWDKTISAVNSEYNYKKFLWYYERDLDNDWDNELVMWDNYNVFIKYYNKGNAKGKGSVVIKPTLKKGSTKQYLSLWGLFSDDIKVYDENAEVKNFMLKWQNFDSISFTWDNNPDEAKSWYLMRLVERVDWFREKNSQSKVKYILFLPNWMEEEIDDLRIQLQWTTQKIKNLLWDKIYEVKYYNPALDVLQFSLPEVPRKWEYVQITTVKLNETVYQQNAPWSNQLVWWRQAIWDWEPPKARVELERVKKNNEVVDDWFDLEWYVWTYYNIRITWYDETKVRVTQLIEMDPENNTWKVLNEKDFDNFMWIVLLPDLFFTKKEKKIYKITAVDSQGNETEETIQLDIQVPWISIEDITRDEWYKDGIKGPVSIISELETDIDKWDVSFERFRNNGTTPITATEGWESKLTYPVTTNQTKVTGQYYDYWNAIGLFTKDNKQIANLNSENWEIELKWEFAWTVKPRVDLSQWYPTVKLMEWDNPLFEIIIQPEKLIKTEVYKWSIMKLEWGNYWAFDWGSVIMKDNKAILYIGPTGVLYTTENLQWDYIFNKSDETVTYEIYEAFGDKIASITFKAKPLE